MRQWQRMGAGLMLLAALLPASAAMAQAGGAAASAQQRYDAAQAAFDKGDWLAARDGFASLVPAAPAPLKPSQAVIAARLAEAQLQLDDYTAARATAARAQTALRENPDEAQLSLLTLADAARLDLDMPAAIAAYRTLAAAAGNSAKLRLRAQTGLAQSAVVFDPPLAKATIDAVLADAAYAPLIDKPLRAQLLALRGRAEMNGGDAAAASSDFARAISASGGLTNNVSLIQVAIRSDAAIAKHLLGNDEAVRNLLTYAGAGHIDWTNVASARLDLPQCARPGDAPDTPRRDDTVVIEFSIKDDGRVARVQAIYASRPGAMGLAFAAEARDWSWPVKAVTGIDRFWRQLVRMQLSCSTLPPRRGVLTLYDNATSAWLRGLDAAPQSGDALAKLRALMAEEGASVNQLSPLLETLDAPPDVRAFVLLHYGGLVRYGNEPAAAAAARGLAPLVRDFAARWPGSRALALVQLELGRAQLTAGDAAAARATLEAVLALPEAAIAPETGIRPVAVTLLATAEKREGKLDAALRRASNNGIDAQQCALFDLRPMPRSSASSSDDFPEEARNMGFEGSVLVGYDVDTSGKPTGVRTLAAYPPFVFNANAEAVMRRTRYVPPLFDGTATGCNGGQRWLTFVNPN